MTKKTLAAKGRKKVHKVMKEYKEGALKSGPNAAGGPVKSRKQAIAIALSEARNAGAPIPENPSRQS